MEYTFKNTVNAKACSIHLNEDHFIFSSGGHELKIHYQKINHVQLLKVNAREFNLTMQGKDIPLLTVSNKYFLTTGECEDRSHEYSRFVKVLHFYMQQKSNSIYSSGMKNSFIVLSILSGAFTGAFVSFVTEFVGWNFIDPYLQAMLVFITAAIIIISVNRKKILKHYSPDKIPAHLLP